MKIITRATSVTISLIVADGPVFLWTDNKGFDKRIRVRRLGVTWVHSKLSVITLEGPSVREDGSDIPWANGKYTITEKALRPDWLVELMRDEGWDW